MILASMLEPATTTLPATFGAALLAESGAPVRLPGRYLRLLGGRPALSQLIERVRRTEGVYRVVAALTVAPEDDVLVPAARAAGAEVFRGSLHDMTGRLVSCADWMGLPDEAMILRIGADAPLVDAPYLAAGAAALATTRAGVFEFEEDQAEELCPGLSAGFIRARALRHIDRRAHTPQHRADPLSYAYQYPGEVQLERSPLPLALAYLLGRHRLLLHTAEDLALLEALYLRLYQGGPLDTAAALRFLDSDPVLASLNRGVLRRGPTLPMTHGAAWRTR